MGVPKLSDGVVLRRAWILSVCDWYDSLCGVLGLLCPCSENLLLADLIVI